MRFPLLKLPSLAYEEVLLNFEIADLVHFSLCSSRCHRIIRSIRFPFTGIDIWTGHNSNILMFYNGTKPVTQWNFVGKLPDWHSTRTQIKKLVVKFKCVRDLFRLPIIRFSLLHTDHDIFPQQFGITKCDEVDIWTDDSIPVDELKYVLEKIEISKKLTLHLNRNDDFECGFVRFSMDELVIEEAFWITNETFLAMDCARISLNGNKTLPIREFVSQWLSSRNTRFEWMKMHPGLEKINWNEGFKPMKWDPKVRGRNFKISSSKRVDCSKGTDFLRDDGLLATVVTRGPNQIYFIVWHKRFQPEADGLELDT